MLTDIAGSTHRWEVAPADMDRCLRAHDGTVRSTVARYGGRVFSTAGDGFAIVFDHIGAATAAGAEMQAALADSPLRVRMGVHVGHAVERDGDFFGPTLNRAARLMSVAHGGQVLFSDAAAALARPLLPDGVALVDLGAHRLRDLSEPEHVWQLSEPTHPEPFPPLHTSSAPLGNLPWTEPLVGRGVDLAGVVDLVRSHHLVTVTGPGGVGKSRLALAAAQDLATGWTDGCWLVELAPSVDPVAAVAGVVPMSAMPSSVEELVDQIAGRELLLVLDNCQDLLDDVAELVTQLLAGCAGLRILCTSQEPLAVDGEHLWPLAPLDPAAAVELFVERARAVRPDLAIDDDTVEMICRRLDALPLALEMAAARVTTMSVGEIAGQLEDRFIMLRSDRRGRPSRQQGLAATVEWSYDHLDDPTRLVFRRVGVFAGGFTRDAAIAVAGADGQRPAEIGGQLDLLVRRSLVVADVTVTPTRYRLLETLRLYARDRLADAGEADAVARRHAEWYADWAARLDGVNSPDEARWLTRGVDEFDNLRAAVSFAVEQADTELAVRLVGRLSPLQLLWRSELLEWAKQVLALPGADERPDAAEIHLLVASMAWVTGDIDTSERAADAALRRPLGESAWMRAITLKHDMRVYRGRLDPEDDLSDLRARVHELPNQVWVDALRIAGEAYYGRPSGVDPVQLLADADRLAIPMLQSLARTMVALSLIPQRRTSDALGLVHDALEVVRPGLNRAAVNVAHEIASLAATEASDVPDQARRALELIRDYPLGLGFALIGLTRAAHGQDRHDTAAVLAGYIDTHLTELALPRHSAENMAGRPLAEFAAPNTTSHFERGQTMTADQLRAELEALADS